MDTPVAVVRSVVAQSLVSVRGRGWISLASIGFLTAAYGIVARSCQYDHLAILRYGGYLALYVWVPGLVVLRGLGRGRVSLVESVALGLPLGFALEILTFLGLSAVGARALYPWTPLVSGGALALSLATGARWQSAVPTVKFWNPWIVCALAALVLAMMVTAASQLFAPAPLSAGQLTDVTHHDWVYLVSRAAEIKRHWPLQDPSLAGAPLSYHYFLMVHLAAASIVTGDQVALLLLRLFVLPLSAALLMQGFALGRTATRSAWGGILAALLMLVADEVSFVASTDRSTFLNLFTRWLYLSPTFYFGVIFTGALILWIHRMATKPKCNFGDFAALAILSAAATGAKGTVVPPLLVALVGWTTIEIFRTRQLPIRMALMTGVMGLAFAAVYFEILAAWGTGEARFTPLASVQLAQFWIRHELAWQGVLEHAGLPPSLSRMLSEAACAMAIMLGSQGVRLVGLVYVFIKRLHVDTALVHWLAAVYTVSVLAGQFMHLDSNSQLYLLFPMRLPSAVLAAAALVALWPSLVRSWRGAGAHAPRYARWLGFGAAAVVLSAMIWFGSVGWWTGLVLFCLLTLAVGPAKASGVRLNRVHWSGFGRFCGRLAPFVFLTAVLLVQVNHWRLRNRQGFALWQVSSARGVDKGLALLNEGLFWIRDHAPADAVIVANAFTPRNLSGEFLANIDRTTVDKYYYYSALAERRFWVEGPSYLADQREAKRRMQVAAEIFYRDGPLGILPRDEGPYYLLVDHWLRDGAHAHLPKSLRVFVNERIAVYQVAFPPANLAAVHSN